MRTTSPSLVGVVLGGALLVSGCGGTTPTGPTPSVAPSSVYPQAVGAAETAVPPGSLVIRDFAYSAVTVRAGSVVTVRNEDPAAHTVTSRQKGLFDVVTPPSTTTRFVAPAAPGRYPFSCTYHGNMIGLLVVT